MFSNIWEFIVRPEHVAAFEAAYGPGGDWDRLFRRDATVPDDRPQDQG